MASIVQNLSLTMPTEADQHNPAGRVAWLDLTDLLEFFRQNNTVTGIQRVVSMIVLALNSTSQGAVADKLSVRLCTYDFTAGCYRALDVDRTRDALSLILAGRLDGSRVEDKIESAADFCPGDVFLVLGAFWFDPSYCQIIVRACVESGLQLAIMCHDLIPMRQPDWYPAGYPTELSAIWDTAFQHARLILTNSRYTAQDVEDYCRSRGLPINSIQPVRLGDEFFNSSTNADRVKGRIRPYVEQGFVLTVGSVGLRKNQILLLRVWERLFKKYGKSTPYLVVIGKFVGPYNVDEHALSAKSSEGRIVHLEDVTDEELAAFYQASTFTVFPSLAEGWGLPVAESLSMGKLCLASTAMAIPEVGGNLVEYFDPTDLEECYRKIELYLLDPELRARAEERIRSGFHATSWRQCVAQLQNILGDVAVAKRSSFAVI